MRVLAPVILPSIPAGGLSAAETHAVVRGEKEFQIVAASNSWTVALEKWSGNSPKMPWRAHMFDASGKWRGVTAQPRELPEQSFDDSLAAIAQKTKGNAGRR